MTATDNMPMAVKGLTSYRCRGRYGWIMIGAKDDDDAMSEALRSCDVASRDTLEIWDGAKYVPVSPAVSTPVAPMMVIEKTNSSFGNYSVRISPTEIRFFFKKKCAKEYIERMERAKAITAGL